MRILLCSTMRGTEAHDMALGGWGAPRLTVALVPETCRYSKLRSELARTGVWECDEDRALARWCRIVSNVRPTSN
jgi:hypothetical protein